MNIQSCTYQRIFNPETPSTSQWNDQCLSEYLWSETWTCPEEGFLIPNNIHLFHGLGGGGGGLYSLVHRAVINTPPRRSLRSNFLEMGQASALVPTHSSGCLMRRPKNILLRRIVNCPSTRQQNFGKKI
ncbi:hypothetical protein CEXT_69501 [Caerostris extrusa]|uniref:Uncharacterized protein n=1 Tax=Caerostris extrusa TaxID=172846 RepID=A0AAV4TIM8_CAEEX|nr:hypothetical protein CEXT_69501 [Caerostris extrusa]